MENVTRSPYSPDLSCCFVGLSGEYGQILGANSRLSHPVSSWETWNIWFWFCTFTQCQWEVNGQRWDVHFLFWVQKRNLTQSSKLSFPKGTCRVECTVWHDWESHRRSGTVFHQRGQWFPRSAGFISTIKPPCITPVTSRDNEGCWQ